MQGIHRNMNNQNIVDRYELHELLGCGRFGVVRSALDTHTNEEVAIKIMDKKKDPLVCKAEAGVYTSLCNSVGIDFSKEGELDTAHRDTSLKFRKHLTIPLNLCEDKTHFYIVMESVPGGDLFDRIVAKKFIPANEFKPVLKGLVKAIDLLHRNNVIHRDIKPENVLFRPKTGSDHDDLSDPVLTDFGLAYVLGTVDLVNKPAGTFGYASPEILTAAKPVSSFSKSIWSSDSMSDPECSVHSSPELKEMRFAADIWSLGVLAYASLAGELPFPASMDGSTTVKEHLEEVYGGPRFDNRRWDNVPPTLVELVRDMLHYSPVNRPSLANILNHPWLTETEEDTKPISESRAVIGSNL
eukprot:CAMPEP_0204829418 /NCGR_PEP_ID=MMETSP1346-20131115/7571_1 /ASSEMBLY_ACC=CAM_ASM_000771 /TAXON_ID=215587 /ORGANISM="Aplanochytrium stocchinoi, Strain GSBS06" /LENGTH=354 /DNA_ID=CAMNT_0051959183 /DNA_START=363 /DNA_END=1427 /DNA_ORIENTATION=+